jgi:hypothetical protein
MRTHASIIIAVTALVVAVFGSTPIGEAAWNQVVPRNSVGPLQLKRNAVTSSKIAPNAIRTGQVVDGSLLTADFKAGQIPQGPKGDKGDKGAKGDPGLTGYTLATGTLAPPTGTSLRNVTATCPTGKKALGGGVRSGGKSSAQGPFVVESYPTPGGAGWTVTVIVGTFPVGTLTAYAVCAAVT